MDVRNVLAVLCLSAVFYSNPASAATCSSTLQNKVGDTISFTAELNSGDVNENGEGEPLYLSTSGGEITATISQYSVPTPFTYTATTANEVISGTNQGYDGDEGCTITASVNPSQPFTPDQKKKAGNLAGELGIPGTILIIGGTALCSLVSAGMCGAVIIAGTGLGGFGIVAGNIASDPSDPNYTTIAIPSIATMTPIVPDSSLTQAQADAFNALIASQASMIGIGNAAYISGNRAQGAHDAGDAVWEAKQIQTTQLYAQQLGGLMAHETVVLGNLHDALASGGISINVTPSDVLNFEYRIAYQGLPAEVTNALTAYGLNAEQINDLRKLLLVQDINAASGTFPDALVSTNLTAAFQDAAKAFSTVIQISLDIKGEGTTNAINPKSNGVIPVAVLGTATFDVTTVDPASTRFGTNAAQPATPPVIADVNGDSIPDLLLHFGTQDTGIQCGDTMAVLTGKTATGSMISGADGIQTVGCK